MSDTSYNGWTNYETWNIALWIDNDESLYHMRRDYQAEKGGKLTPQTAQAFCWSVYPEGTPDMDGRDDMQKVNWSEVAENWNEDS